MSEQTKLTDAIVVLGGGLTPYGQPLRPTVSRAQEAASLWRQDTGAEAIILSGGVIAPNDPDQLTEAEIMRQLLLAEQIPDESLILEKDSLETIGNACWTWDIVADNKLRNLRGITSKYHLGRAVPVFGRIFGPDFNIDWGEGVKERATFKRQLKEPIGRLATNYALWGTDNNPEAIKKRLEYLHPLYIERLRAQQGKEPLSRSDLRKRHVVTTVKQLFGSSTELPQAA